MKLTLSLTILLSSITSFSQTCTCNYSFTGNYEVKSFIMQSNINNPHFYWNFGDGSGTYIQNPVHTFPESGNYLVTLYVNDSVNNCSTYYETWIKINKIYPDGCLTGLKDSLFVYANSPYLKIDDTSVYCGNYNSKFDIGSTFNSYIGNWNSLDNWWPSRVLSRVRHSSPLDTTAAITREAYKTVAYKYSSANNYHPCSANFEFSVVSSSPLGQRFLFKAMNKNAQSYEWSGYNLGSPIYSDTMSIFYSYNYFDMYLVSLKTTDSSGCRDSLVQQILNRSTSATVGIKELKPSIQEVKLYPNPVASILNVEVEAIEPANLKLTINNIFGQVVYHSENVKAHKQELDLSFLRNGLYFLKIQSGSDQKTFKIIKE